MAKHRGKPARLRRPSDDKLASFCWRHDDVGCVERMLKRAEARLDALGLDTARGSPFPSTDTRLGSFSERDWWNWIDSVQSEDDDHINALKRLVATCRIRLGSQIPHNAKAEPKLKILVSSVVYGYEDLLESIYALLETFGYEVLMSHKGTVPIDPNDSAMNNCLRAVDHCHLFLGLILPRYGSGKEGPNAKSITHREAEKAIALNKPRWFLVHEHVAVARQLLMPYRHEAAKPAFKLKPGVEFKSTPILSDLRVLEVFEAAMRHDIDDVADRSGNWAQPFGPDDDARLFATAQFRRYRELAEKHLPKLKDVAAIRSRVKGEGK